MIVRLAAPLLLLALGVAAAPVGGWAQVQLDGSIVAPGVIGDDAAGNYTIPDDAGAYSGPNLFHSFLRFGVPAGGSATFTWGDDAGRATAPDRVVARVTGGDLSDIRGLLAVEIPEADLFLLNPDGVRFRQGSALDLDGGSLYVSTAHVLRFFDGAEFTTTDQQPPALTTSDPTHFGFLGAEDTARVEITSRAALRLDPGEALTLVGSGVDISASGTRVDLAGATLQLAAAGADADVDLPVDLAGFDPSSAAPGTLGRVRLTPNTVVNASADVDVPTGSVIVRGERFELGGGEILAENSSSDAEPVGPIDIAVSGEIEIQQNSAIRTGGTGPASPVLLSGDSIVVLGGAGITNQSLIETRAEGDARGPDIELTAREVRLEGGRFKLLRTIATDTAEGGDIRIEADTFTFTGGGTVLSENAGSGAGGGITITALDPANPSEDASIGVAEGSQVASVVNGDGSGGAIELVTHALRVESDGDIVAQTNAGGDGAPVTVDAQEVLVSGAGSLIATVASATVEDRPGDPVKGGDLTVRTQTLDLLAGGQLFTRTEGPGDAGALAVIADTVLASGQVPLGMDRVASGISTRTEPGATGDGGLLTIDARILRLENGAEVASGTRDSLGSGGDIVITASESVIIESGEEGTSLVAATSLASRNMNMPVPVGPGGTLTIDTNSLVLRNGGQVTASATGDAAAPAGDVVITAESVEISGVNPFAADAASGVFAQSLTNGLPTDDAAAGGNIDITADLLRISEGGTVSASTVGGGTAGTVSVDAGTVALDAGSIQALSVETGQGDGGSIAVNADTLLLTDGAEITAQSQGSGDAGRIDLVVADRFEARGSSVTTLAAETTGGQVTLTGAQSVFLQDSRIETSVAEGAGGGGDVTVGARIVTLDGGEVIASAADGAGGNISIPSELFFTSQPLFVQQVQVLPGVGAESALDATSGVPALSGVIDIAAPDTDLISKLERLPAEFLDVSSLLAGPCGARTERTGSFTVVRRSSPAAPPDEELPALESGEIAGPECPRVEVTP